MVSLELLLGAALVGALTCYLLTGGADFGAGIWTCFAFGRSGRGQRALIDEAIGPIWEANHVWLIVAVTILFTAFPPAFSVIATGLHIPLSLMLVGIVLRGTAFAVRTHDITSGPGGDSSVSPIWRHLFAVSSIITPALLGICVGAVASGRLSAASSASLSFSERFVSPWLSAFPVSVGLLTITLVAYLAAVYLLVEAKDQELRSAFRRRAIAAGMGVLVTGGYALLQAREGAPEIQAGLLHTPIGLSAIVMTVGLHVAALMTLWKGRDRAARRFAAAGAVIMLWGWALSQYPYLVEPNITIADAAPPETLRLLLVSLILGSILLLPLLYYLYRIFKGRAVLDV